VLFDLDDTLFAHRRAVEEGARSLLRELQDSSDVSAEAEEIARWNDLEELHYTRYLSGELDYLGQRHARARDFMLPHGVTFASNRDAEEWFDYYLTHYQAAWSVYDDTVPALDALADLRLGIITNGDLTFQLAKMDAVGLTPRFEHVVASGEVGLVKPNPEIFRYACSLFGVAPADAVYIGDRLHTDAIGASAAGLTGLWLSRGDATREELAIAEANSVRVIRSLAELPSLLALRD
jgi:putative hydrolase of the HAD superfamily